MMRYQVSDLADDLIDMGSNNTNKLGPEWDLIKPTPASIFWNAF
jgi:hypothetical protein